MDTVTDEKKYYFISYLTADFTNNFYNDIIDINPMEWLERVNRREYAYFDENKKPKMCYPTQIYMLISFFEISKAHFEILSKIRINSNMAARNNLKLSYGINPYI